MARKQAPPKPVEDDEIEFEETDEREEAEESEDSAESAEPLDDDIVPDIGDELDDDLLHDIDSDIEGIEDIVEEELPPVVGGELDAFCTKCKRLTPHTVVSMLRGRPAKVLCNVCESQHQYRTGAPEAGRESRTKAAPRNRALWEDACQRSDGRALPYEMTGSYETDQLIEHPKFGKGVVVRTYDVTKMEVLFQDQVRRLIQKRR
ncbi:MAG: hypothetical protein RBU45_03070 [Myxococcota bacterium]|jgi:hypothetical protein|nr:hypothetical protein [Myxococcota bacterium]